MNRSPSLPLARWDWPLLMMGVLAVWLSGSLLVDLVIVPSLSVTGLMAQPGFVSAGYVLFSGFNHLELLLAGMVVSGSIYLHQQGFFPAGRWVLGLCFTLLAIALVYTYGLTPALSDLGFDMAGFNGDGSMPPAMIPLHGLYWGLEVVKLGSILFLLRSCYQGMPHWRSVS